MAFLTEKGECDMPLHDETFNLNIWDHSPVAYCVAELVLDADG